MEVINGGIPSGTTAEALTHYHFKFHFFKPDVVVINPGLNDTQGLVSYPFYHPDHSHDRQTFQLPHPLPDGTRMIAKHSCLFSLVLISMIYGRTPEPTNVVKNYHGPPVAAWYDKATKPGDIDGWKRIPKEETSFRHDLDALCNMILRDGAKVVLVPVTVNPSSQGDPSRREFNRALEFEYEILRELAREKSLGYAPFPAKVISEGQWTDDCHNTSLGQLQKAWHVAPYVARTLWGENRFRSLSEAESRWRKVNAWLEVVFY